VPAGNPRGGQWSNRNEGGASVGFGGSGSGDGEASAQGMGGAEDTGSTGGSQDAATSEAESSQRPEGDGTRGYDDRLAASDKLSPGRTAMLGIMARAAERVMQAYRSDKGLFDLFGNRDGTVAYTTIDDKDIFGANSNSPTYTATDRREAEQMRDTLISKYPGAMNTTSIGKMPNDAIFHAESNVLLRAARENGGTLAGRSLDVFVDSKMCNNCERIVPLVGLELGNPTITIVDTTKVPRTFRDGVRLK
jgi:type II secretory pathway pseudopilin PulG